MTLLLDFGLVILAVQILALGLILDFFFSGSGCSRADSYSSSCSDSCSRAYSVLDIVPVVILVVF